MDRERTRRRFLATAAGAGLVLGAGRVSAARPSERGEPNPTEDLMREHGVLQRALLIYEEAARRLEQQERPAEVVSSAAQLIAHFIEGYHEKVEEEHVFPRLAQGALGPLVQVLRAQHDAGRRVTAEILQLASPAKLAAASARQALAIQLRAFSRMYRPHAAREDTELFPAFHALFSDAAFDALGEQFEEQEHRRVGAGGFESAVREVAELERALGLNDLAQFTPR